jgi:UDP-N-acetylmuramate--alanine ligase
MKLKDVKNIYCLGIGGIGVSGLARLLRASGKNVWGSDLRQSQATEGLESLGMKVFIGHSLANLANRPDLVIYSQDVSEDSPGFVEMAEIDRLAIPKLTQAQAIGELMEGHYGIGVTGTNGKSTTSAMLGLILTAADLDPTVLIGSLLSPKNETEKFQANARLGSGKYFVTESDEYHRKMLDNKPKMIVVTNIAEDHLDYYKDLDEIKQAFLEYTRILPPDGILIYNADDHNSVEVCRQATCHKFTFGVHHYADLQALNVNQESRQEGGLAGIKNQEFDVHFDDEKIATFNLHVPGVFNISNALGAALAALKLGVKVEVIQKTLSQYAGIWRRFEIVGTLDEKPIISDYAHHPAGVAATIQAAKEFYPGKKVLTVFQPHHRNRTKSLFGEFVESLMGADEVIIPEIFDVAGREHGEEISSTQLVEELQIKTEHATFAKDLDEAGQLIREKLPNFDVVLMMGAGDIDSLARKMVK